MKKFLLSASFAVLLIASTGCADGPVRRMIRNTFCNDCRPPAAPCFQGLPATPNASCPTGTCGGANNHITSYGNQGDPYLDGSNANGATITPPVFDNYGGLNFGGTTGSPGSNGILPSPNGQ